MSAGSLREALAEVLAYALAPCEWCHDPGRCHDCYDAAANPRPLANPIPARGRLGFWRPDAGLVAAIREQVGD